MTLFALFTNFSSAIFHLAGLMKIFPKNGLPLLFVSQIGTLGQISIYLKSKKDIEEEEFKNDDSDSD